MRKNGVLFLTIKVFSATGGIEKVCRIVGKALTEIAGTERVRVHSIYDEAGQVIDKYFPATIFRGFKANKISFFTGSVLKGLQSRVILLSHANLLAPAMVVKLLAPKTKIILFTHGIEVWKPFSKWKTKALQRCDVVLCVSAYTRQKMLELHQLSEAKCVVLNNCLDPFLAAPAQSGKPAALMQQYGLKTGDTVLLTLSRLSAHDRDKGYEKVLIAMQQLSAAYPNLKYLIVGKYKPEEKQWLDEMTRKMCLQDRVVITGFVTDEALGDHFGIADLYVMPSIKEGFGIIFIEAMLYGLPVIAGNKDGSVDALANGAFGLLVDPYQQQEITAAIQKVVDDRAAYLPDQQQLLKRFGYETYKAKLKELVVS